MSKLDAYRFDDQDCKQRTKINNTNNSYSDIIYGVPQGSTLGTVLFSIHICHVFLQDFNCDIASYADDNVPYTSDHNLDTILKIL